MKNFSASPLNDLIRAITRFFGMDFVIITCALIAPAVLFPWLIRNISYYLELRGELNFYIPYFALLIIFIGTAFLRSHFFDNEGLTSYLTFSPRMFIGNVLVITAVAAIAMKRHTIKTIDYVTMYERSVVAIDILFLWVIANFVVQLVINIFYFFTVNKGE